MHFFKDKIQHLGHVVTKEGISVDLEKIKAIEDWLVPKDVTNVQSFMGITGGSLKGFRELQIR